METRALPPRAGENAEQEQRQAADEQNHFLKEAERALRESEARYRSLFESASDGILVADAAGSYVEVNPSGLAMLGYSRDELIGMKSTDVLAPRKSPAWPRP
jgi:PAS domain-containing protein